MPPPPVGIIAHNSSDLAKTKGIVGMFASRNRHPRHDKIAEALMEASHLLSDKDGWSTLNVFH